MLITVGDSIDFELREADGQRDLSTTSRDTHDEFVFDARNLERFRVESGERKTKACALLVALETHAQRLSEMCGGIEITE